ncbi:MAG: hypothetical protein P1U41_05920 [Vicingaceae bacterium]|nr:hypothetical protein [Vicingaceae bacterium]
MKKLLYISLIAMSLILMACPYDGEVELCSYDEALKTDKKLLDQWVAFNEEGGRDEVLVEKGNKAVLIISRKNYEKGNKLNSLEKYRAYPTEIKGEIIYTIEKEDGRYHYCKYDWISKNEFNMQFIDESFMKNNFKADSITTKNTIEFLSENLNNGELFTDKMEFYRKYSPEYQKVKIFMQKSGF